MALTPTHYRVILHRELKKLHKEISAYQSEESLWIVPKGTVNSGGNLALHLIGNLKFYFGDALGKQAYLRDKSVELSSKGIPRDTILKEIEALFEPLKEILDSLPEEVLSGDFPKEVEGKVFPMELMLHHLLAHFSYHLGQIDYHRRIVEGY